MEHVLISILTIMACGIVAQWVAWRFNIPGIALFLLIGFWAGPLMRWVEPDFLMNDLLYATVSTFVAIILFEGSLQLKWRELRESGTAIGHLVFMGALITMVLGAVGGAVILGLEPRMAVLLGAILVVTGPTVVLPLLRQIRPAGKLGAILKWEGIAIDPLGALVAVLVYEVILTQGAQQIFGIFTVGIFRTVFLGVFIGLAAAGIVVLAFRRYLVPEHLRNPFVLTVVIVSFIVSALWGNEPTGFLSVTVMGMTLANQGLIPIRGMMVFKETLKSLILPALFIILAARLPLSDLHLINGRALVFLLFLIFVVRPAAVFLSTRSCGLSRQERLFLSFMAPRGIVAAAVASLFSDRLVEAGFQEAGALVILVFFVVSATVIFYGIAAPLLAHVLKLARPRSSGILIFGAGRFAVELARSLKTEGAEVLLIDRNADRIRAAEAAGLEVFKEDIFSEEVFELVEERGFGRLLALTPNQEANSLAVEHLRHLMEPGELYQLTPPVKSKLREGHHLVGRFLFNEDMHFHALETLVSAGEIARSSVGSREGRNTGFSALFSSDGKGRIIFCTTDHQEEAVQGKTVFGFFKEVK